MLQKFKCQLGGQLQLSPFLTRPAFLEIWLPSLLLEYRVWNGGSFPPFGIEIGNLFHNAGAATEMITWLAGTV